MLFESGAIVHHIAARTAALMPDDEAGRATTLSWMFAALNSVEPAVMMLCDLDLFNPGASWAEERRPALVQQVQTRLADVERALGQSDYLLERFTAADILMASVLNNLRHTPLVAQYPSLHAYHQRCIKRPAALRALASQMALYEQPVAE